MPLDNRLQMAFGAIISQNFPLPNKEQIVIDWMARVLQENDSCCDIILEMIQKTLACDWFVAFSDPIDGSNLIEVKRNLTRFLKLYFINSTSYFFYVNISKQ